MEISLQKRNGDSLENAANWGEVIYWPERIQLGNPRVGCG
jgi:hypothetical protein